MALIDTGADTITISYALWVELGKLHLTAHRITLTVFSEQEVQMLGKCNLPIYVFGHKCTHDFFVFPKNVSNTQMILGEPWQQAFQCTLKWHKEAVKIVVKKEKLLIPFANFEDTCKPSKIVTPQDSKDKEVEAKTIPSSSTSPKDAITTTEHLEKPTTTPQPSTKITQKRPKKTRGQHQVWVPKALVNAQSQKKKIWIPKCPQIAQQPLHTKATPSQHRRCCRQVKPLGDGFQSNYFKRNTTTP